MVNKLILLSCVLITGCTGTSCLQSVAVSQLTVTEAAKTVKAVNETGEVSHGDMVNAARYVTDAGDMVNKAAPMCLSDEGQAKGLLEGADNLIGKLSNIMKGE